MKHDLCYNLPRIPRPGGYLSIKVLLADDSDVMRCAIVKLLDEESSIELVGEAKGFAETIQLANGCIVAISVWNDEKAKALAERFGARVLLDKTNLYAELISAIKQNSPPNGWDAGAVNS
jgi:DNA-binding NarL/FixJ family response regulator